ncbi:thioredoxin-domain-containing protein [Lepidopterella palustris CBS 459.81]|uniref:Thioredoxin-domain-containing protein n=1 Tax=Lepidopterella palustris CBS 459.81 TaxID=1314670 RepID=A0A8E2E9T4_9PEZI|nr:thioredoxin-domain-containing protein [Lepidopterella palustris CBS 459.81]
MSKPTSITDQLHFQTLVKGTTYLVADFYADWCGPCKTIAPFYEQLSTAHSAAGQLGFVKVNVDSHQGVAREYDVTAMPTFIVFKNGKQIERIRGANPSALRAAVQKITAELAKEKEEKATQKPVETPQGEEKTVSGSYGLTSNSNWRMSLN